MRDQATKPALLVDAREAARLLSVSTRKLWGMTFEEDGGPKFVRCGRLVRYAVDDLRQWIEANRSATHKDCESSSRQPVASI